MERSRYISNEGVSNNSAIVTQSVTQSYYRRRYSLSIYCSTSKPGSSLGFILPDGETYYMSYDYGIRKISTSQIQLSMDTYDPQTGIYTCIETDSSGLDTMEINFGVHISLS